MRSLLLLLLLLLFAPPSGAQQETPTSNPTEVIVKGRKVSHSWRNGRIWVPTGELQPLLNMTSEYPSMDLIKALQDKGGYLWQIVDGKLVAKPDPALYSVGNTANARGSNAANLEADAARQQQAAEAEAQEPGKLYYVVREFTAEETGYVRAWIGVENAGPNDSDPSEMICEFTDGFGKPYAQDKRAIPVMAAGESKVYEIFSMVREEDTSMKVTKENVNCYFFSQTNPHLNPQTRAELRKQARERKR